MRPTCEVANYDPYVEDELLWDHLHYLAGLITKRGGGPRRSVYAQFAVWLGGKCLQCATEWAQRLRDGQCGSDTLPSADVGPS
jgi:hypothetical protein